MRYALLMAIALFAACGMTRVDERAVGRLPLEAKLDLIEAENDIFIAVDAVDEAANRVLEVREDYRNSSARIAEAKEALGQAEEEGDAKLIEIGELSVQESKERREFLSAWLDVAWAALDVEKAKLELARARHERIRAQAVKKANVQGAQDIQLEKFDAQVADCEAEVKEAKAQVEAVTAESDRRRGTWFATRRMLASKTGGAEGSPWVE